VRLWDLLPVCVCLSHQPQPFFMKLGMYIMASQPISVVYFINTLISRCLMCIPLSFLGNGEVKCIPHNVTKQRLGKKISAAKNACNNRRIDWGAVFYTIRVASKEILWVWLYISLSLLGNDWVNALPLQWRIVGGVVLYAVHGVSKENGRSVFNRIACTFTHTETCDFFGKIFLLFIF
jgi:hypothetical protein